MSHARALVEGLMRDVSSALALVWQAHQFADAARKAYRQSQTIEAGEALLEHLQHERAQLADLIRRWTALQAATADSTTT